MELTYIPIDKENINKQPDRFRINIDGVDLIFLIAWNSVGKFFSLSLYNEDDEPIIEGRRIVYGVNLIENIYTDLELPDVEIRALDKSGEAINSGVTYENFGDEVKLYII